MDIKLPSAGRCQKGREEHWNVFTRSSWHYDGLIGKLTLLVVLLIRLPHVTSSVDSLEYNSNPPSRKELYGEQRADRSRSANVSDGQELVAAILDQSVERIFLASEIIDVPQNLWNESSATLPVIITRNITIEGSPSRWPLLRLQYATDVMRLLEDVVMVMRFLFLDGAFGDNISRESGFGFVAPTLPGGTSYVYLESVGFTVRLCFPGKYRQSSIRDIPRPPGYPGNQTVFTDLPMDGCRTGPDVPPMERCWVVKALAVDVVGYGEEVAPSDTRIPTNILFLLSNTSSFCEEQVDLACLSKGVAPLLCYIESLQKLKADHGTSPLDDYQRWYNNVSYSTAEVVPGTSNVTGRGIAAPADPKSSSSALSRNKMIGASVGASAGAIIITVLAIAVFASWIHRKRRSAAAATPPMTALPGATPTAAAAQMPVTSRAASAALPFGNDFSPDSVFVADMKCRIGPSYCDTYNTAVVDGVDKAVTGDGAPAASQSSSAAARTPSATAAAAAGAALTPMGSSSGIPVTPYTLPRTSFKVQVKFTGYVEGALACPKGGSVGSDGDCGTFSTQQEQQQQPEASNAAFMRPKDGDAEVDALARHLTPEAENRRLNHHQQDFGGSTQPGAGSKGDPVIGESDDDTIIAGEKERAHVVELLPVVRGKGAFGRVVEGIYKQQRVAVKLLWSAGQWGIGRNQAAFLDSFAQEVEVLSRCNHPNIVRLLAACVEEPQVCLVMELMDTSLERVLYGKPSSGLMPLSKVLHIGISIASALAYLHPTIVHRDLKPANVLVNDPLSDRPIIKLTDFGLSRLRVTVVPTEHPDAGTPAYMAPECFDLLTDKSVITHKADMYSMGVLLWEMLAGCQPWHGVSPLAIAFTVLSHGVRLPLHVINERCSSPKLVRLIKGCWEKDPERRPAAAEMAKELTLVLQQLQQQPQ